MIDFRISRLMQKCAAFFKSPRFAMLMVAMVATGVAIAQTSDINVTAGTGALESVAQGIAKYVPFITKLCYAIASLLSLYSATNIYLKLQYGEEGFTKSVMTLVFSILFLIASTTVMPAFFGIRSYPGGGAGYGPGQYATGYYGHSAW